MMLYNFMRLIDLYTLCSAPLLSDM